MGQLTDIGDANTTFYHISNAVARTYRSNEMTPIQIAQAYV
jgi:hypothetical protein